MFQYGNAPLESHLDTPSRKAKMLMDVMEHRMEKNWFFIVNPHAGSLTCGQEWNKIHPLIEHEGIDFMYRFTEGPGHATELAKEAVEKGFRNIASVGGDGTANETANGILLQEKVPSHLIKMGLVSVGTGNDWGKTVGIPKNYREAVRTLVNGTPFTQDAGIATFYKDGFRQKRYFLNMAGMGYDAFVCERTNQLKEKGKTGKSLYLWTLLMGLLKFKKVKLEFESKEKSAQTKAFSLNVAICKYSGGGMMFAPNAEPDDGLLDLTVIKDLGVLSIIRHLGKLYDGSFINLDFVETYRSTLFKIKTKPEITLELDGENVGSSPFEFSITPRAITVMTNR